jgi:hypothetical protein
VCWGVFFLPSPAAGDYRVQTMLNAMDE